MSSQPKRSNRKKRYHKDFLIDLDSTKLLFAASKLFALPLQIKIIVHFLHGKKQPLRQALAELQRATDGRIELMPKEKEVVLANSMGHLTMRTPIMYWP